MKQFQDYLVPIKNDKGEQVAMGIDFESMGKDIAKDRFQIERLNIKVLDLRKAFTEGFIEGFTLASTIKEGSVPGPNDERPGSALPEPPRHLQTT